MMCPHLLYKKIQTIESENIREGLKRWSKGQFNIEELYTLEKLYLWQIRGRVIKTWLIRSKKLCSCCIFNTNWVYNTETGEAN